jgi:chromosome segregation ATPase
MDWFDIIKILVGGVIAGGLSGYQWFQARKERKKAQLEATKAGEAGETAQLGAAKASGVATELAASRDLIHRLKKEFEDLQRDFHALSLEFTGLERDYKTQQAISDLNRNMYEQANRDLALLRQQNLILEEKNRALTMENHALRKRLEAEQLPQPKPLEGTNKEQG